MRLIIAGSRTVAPSPVEIDAAFRVVPGFHPFPFTKADVTSVVSGTAAGADQAGEEWARLNSIDIIRFPAAWSTHGKAAGKLRNREMADYADAALVFWDGMSSGAADMVARMVAREKPVRVIPTRKK